jgi:hypothetical protein
MQFFSSGDLAVLSNDFGMVRSIGLGMAEMQRRNHGSKSEFDRASSCFILLALCTMHLMRSDIASGHPKRSYACVGFPVTAVG